MNVLAVIRRVNKIMNKEYLEALESLERIDNTLCLNNIKGKLEFGIDTEEHTDCDSVIGMTEDLETIKQALQRLEAIDNANPSQALEWLEKSKNMMILNNSDFIAFDCLKVYSVCKQALLKLDFLEDAMDLPTNCFSTFKNRNGDEVTIMRRERYEEYCAKEKALKELFENHIELVVEKDRCYFKIKNSKGKEKSFTSYTMLDFWKEVLE